MSCYVEEINGTTDHVHVIFLLNPQRTVSDIFKQVKGAVSHEINSTNLIKEKFSWQVGYGGFSISESKVEEAKNYVLKQKQHHKKMTFKEEYYKFVELYGLKT